jgi:hypothetical protein
MDTPKHAHAVLHTFTKPVRIVSLDGARQKLHKIGEFKCTNFVPINFRHR